MGKIAVHLSGRRSRPARWTWASALAAPVSVAGGWTLAQAAQPRFDPVAETISDLVREGLDHRWIMTTGLAGLGVAHLLTAAGLRPLRPAGRLLLAASGSATVAVAVFPQPATGSSTAHAVAATSAFVGLALWPATTATRGGPAVVRPAVAVGASAVSTPLLVWFASTLGGDLVGLSERVLALQQAVWPLVVTAGLGASRRRSGATIGA